MLRRLGFDELAHDSHVPFLSHLLGTRRVLVSWGAPAYLCDAGLFHSVYGTEYFPTGSDVTRDEVRAVIGTQAERLVWLWCTIRRESIEPSSATAVDRRSGGTVQMESDEVSAVATLWAADTVEQLDRMEPEERGFAKGLLEVLQLASPPARFAAGRLLAATPLQ